MQKHPFVIFTLIMGVLIAGSLWFIQSPYFAGTFKKIITQYIPGDLGITGNFSEFSVTLFPPGITIKNPAIDVKERNIMGLPPGAALKAEKMEISFLPFQIFYGDIRVHRLRIVNGEVRISFNQDFLSPKKKKIKSGLDLNWDSFLKVRADALEFENTSFHFEILGRKLSFDFIANQLNVSKSVFEQQSGYQASLRLSDIKMQLPKSLGVPSTIQELKSELHLSDKKLDLLSFQIKQGEMVAKGYGKINSDLLSAKEFPAEFHVEASGELSNILREWSQKRDNHELPKGDLIITAKVSSSLERFLKTAQVSAKIQIKDFQYKKWKTEQIEVEGQWNAPEGKIFVSKGFITSREVPRKGGGQPGSGGKVEIGEFHWKLNSTDLVTVPLILERAHLHWLAAPGLEDIYALDLRVSGPLSLKVYPPDSEGKWNVNANVGLKIHNFQLDNQRFKKEKPLKKILFIPEIALEGGVQVDPKGVYPNALKLLLPNSKFQVDGKVDFNTGFDLRAQGDLQCDDIGELAEVKIRGAGTLQVRVHGPSARTLIDFDADLKDAEYLNLYLGHLLGRITWDDDPQKLIINNVGLTKGQTPLLVNGELNLKDHETISLGFQIQKGDIYDVVGVFNELTKNLWWFPRSIKGAVEGRIQVEGGLDLKELDVLAQVSGTQWEYFGERFKTAYLRGGYERGKYFVETFKAVKRNGKINGHISFDQEAKLDWKFHSEDLFIGELDHIARLDVPIRGKLFFSTQGHGKFGNIDSSSHFSLTEAVVRGVGVDPSVLQIKSSGGITNFKVNFFEGRGIAELVYNSKLGSFSYLKGKFQHLDFSPLLLLLNPTTIQDQALVGVFSGEIDLSFKSGEAERASGFLSLQEYILAKAGAKFQLNKPVQVKVDKGHFYLPDFSIKGERGTATLTLKSDEAQLEGSVKGEMDLSIVEFFTPTVTQASGIAKLDLDIGGTLLSPSVNGKTLLEGKFVRIRSLESPFENIRGILQLKQNNLIVQNLDGDLANGRVGGGGTIKLFLNRYPTLDLQFSLAGNKLKIFPFQFVKARGDLQVTGETIPYLVTGKIFIDSALSREKMMSHGAGRALRYARYFPSAALEREGEYPKFKLNIHAESEKGISIQNDFFDAELKGSVTVINTIETPRVLGNAEVIQGKMTFKDRVFQIQSASMIFDNPTVINPRFNLSAQTEMHNTKIQLYASGKLTGYKVELSSNPVMTEQEILTLLALGLSAEDMKRLGSADRGTVDKSKATDLLLHSMDFNRDIQDKTGFQIKLDETVSTPAGSSIFRPREDTPVSSVAPKVVVKRRIGKKLELSVGSTVGVGTSTEQQVNAEVKLTPGFSVIGVWDSIDDATTQNRTSYGVDLKLQKRFR